MAREGWSHTFLMVTSLIFVMATQASHGLPAADGNNLKTKLKCTADPQHSIADVENGDQEFYINPEEDFSYFQISMKIGSCYPFEIYRGNRYFGREILGSPESGLTQEGIPVSLSCASSDGNHAYLITIGLRNMTLTKEVDTATSCGKCRGFRVKAVGATVCSPEVTRNSRSMTPLLDTQVSRGVEKIRRWSTVAYVMAVCSSLLLYVVILTVRSFRGVVDVCKADRLQPDYHTSLP